MKEYNFIRWERLKELGLDFSHIKSTIRQSFECQIRENDIDNFVKSINKYNAIDECSLLNLLEEDAYNKALIFSIQKYKKNKHMPIVEDITNTMFMLIFKELNDINTEDGKYYDGELDSCFKVAYYNRVNNLANIKLSRVIKSQLLEELEDGTSDSTDIEIYDCCKFLIDINNKLVIMFFNDIKTNDTNPSREITIKKHAFRSLFTDVSSRNILKYSLNNYLEQYFKDYMDDKRKGIQRKLISVIEASSVNGIEEEKSLIRSVNKDYEHSEKRLVAIENDIAKEGLTISELECCNNEIIVDLKMDGEICCINNIFSEEVIKNVCKEFFNGYEFL